MRGKRPADDKTGEKCLTLVNESPGPDWSGGVVTNGYLLHSGPWAPAMTEEEAMEYLLQKDVPRAVWADHDRANFPRFRIVRRDALRDMTRRTGWQFQVHHTSESPRKALLWLYMAVGGQR